MCSLKNRHLPSIGILLAYFNDDKYIGEQIASILNQTYGNFFIHIFDDASDDKYVLFLEKFQKEYPNKVKIHRREKNLGFSKNFLTGLNEIPNYDFYAFSDQDDIWKKTKLQTYLEIYEEQSGNLDLIGASSILIDSNGKILGKGKRISNSTSTKDILVRNPCGGNTMMFTHKIRELLKELKVDVPYHDWITIILASIQSNKIKLLQTESIYYRIHENNIEGNIRSFKILLKKFSYVFSGQYKKNLRINLRAVQSLTLQHSDETAKMLRDFNIFLNGSLKNRLLQFYKNGFWSSSYLVRFVLFITIFIN